MIKRFYILLLAIVASVGMSWADTYVTITQNDFPTVVSNSFTKDGVTVSAVYIDGDYNNILGGGSFSTTLGNFTKIEVNAMDVGISGEGWSGDYKRQTWTGNASSVSFSGDIMGNGMGVTLMFTIGDPAPTYTVALQDGTANADKVTLSATSAVEGATVTVTPDDEYEITAFKATYNTTEELSTSFDPATGAYSFTMPAYDVTIEATIALKPVPEGDIFAGFTATAGSGGFDNEGHANLVDNKFTDENWTKWCTNNDHRSVPTGESGDACWWIDFEASAALNLTGYILTTGNDAGNEHGRNPKNWLLKAKLNADDAWTTIATVTDDVTMKNKSFKDYKFFVDQSGSYKYFRFEVFANQGADVMQLCELRLIGTETAGGGSTPTTWTSLSVGDVIKVGDKIEVPNEGDGSWGINGNVLRNAWGPYTLIRADIYQESEFDDPVVTETEDGAFYVFKAENSDFYPLSNLGKGTGLLVVTGTSDGLEVTAAENKSFTVAVHEPNPSGSCGDNLTWEFNTETGALTISGTGAMNDYSWDPNAAPWYAYRNDITSVSFPEGITTIGAYAFVNCDNAAFTTVTIPEGVIALGVNAFYGCSALTTVSIPSTVTDLGVGAFYSCPALTEITSYIVSPTEIPWTVFNAADKETCKLYVPYASIAAYKATEGWKDFKNIKADCTDPETELTISKTSAVIGDEATLHYTTLSQGYFISITRDGVEGVYGTDYTIDPVPPFPVHELTATVKALKAGKFVIKATLAQRDDYCGAEDSVIITVIDPAVIAPVIAAIDAVPATPLTDATKKLSEYNKVLAAREAYDALSDEEKAAVTNYDKLEAAEEAFAAIGGGGDAGALKGEFSVADGKVVYFSKGNLQLIASNTWKFADNQWDYFGTEQSDNHRDLFGWGAINETQNTDHAAYTWNEWGENTDLVAALGTGWRTLTKDEWDELLFTRSGATVNGTADARFAKATINTDGTAVTGVILFPDDYDGSTPAGVTWGDINATYDYYSTSCTEAGWDALEALKCVFLPVTSERWGTSVSYVGERCAYWSSTASDEMNAYNLRIEDTKLLLSDDYRGIGDAVRLVTETASASDPIADAQAVKDLIDSIPSPVVYTPECKEAIDAARAALDALSDEAKALFATADTAALPAAETAYADLLAEKVAPVIAKIDALPSTPLTEENTKLSVYDKVVEARAAYDALTDEEKAAVDNYDKLTAAEAAFAAIGGGGGAPTVVVIYKSEFTSTGVTKEGVNLALSNGSMTADDMLAMDGSFEFSTSLGKFTGITIETDANIMQIDEGAYTSAGWPTGQNLGTSAVWTGESETVLISCMVAGNAITITCTVAPASVIDDAKAALALINAIPDPVEYTPECKAAIDAAKDAYDALNDETKALLEDADVAKLTAAVDAFATIENIWISGDCKVILYKDNTMTVSKLPGDGNGAMADYTSYYGDNTAPWYNNHWYNPQQGDILIKSITIEEGVTQIGTYAFGWVNDLKTVTISASVTSIPDNAFYWSRAVNDIYLYADPANLTWGANSGNFKESKGTRCHAPMDLLAAYQEKFADINVTFVGDLPPVDPQAMADAVEALIDAIGEVNYPDSKAAIDAARAAYDLLPADVQALVENYATLTAAEATYADLLAAAVAEVVAKIEALPATPLTEENTKLSVYDKVVEARAAFEALTDEEKAAVTNLAKLEAIEDAFAASPIADAKAALTLINAIGEVTYPDSKDAIEAARAAVNALGENASLLDDVDLAKLTGAEAEYAKQKADYDAADAVVAKIDAIPAPVVFTDECKAAIDSARAAYNALTEDQKALVDPAKLDLLTAAEAAYDKLVADHAAADAVIAKIDALPDSILYTDAHKALIDEAREAYSALTDDQKALVDPAKPDALTAAETAYAALQEGVEIAIAKIDAIPAEIAYNADCKEAIDDAREVFDALTAEQKAAVTNLSRLEAAEITYAALAALYEHNVQFVAGENVLAEETLALLKLPNGAPEVNGFAFDHWEVMPAPMAAGLHIVAIYRDLITVHPVAFDTLMYNGIAQNLVTAGVPEVGHLEYRIGEGAWATTLPQATNAGVYAIQYKLVREGKSDYIAPYTLMATIAKAPVTYIAPVAYDTLVYNASAQTLIVAGSTNDGTMEYTLTPTDAQSWNTALPQGLGAGTYNVSFRVIGDQNHLDSVAPAPVAVTIAKAALTATADDKTVIYGDAAPEYTVTYAGWQGADDANVLTGTITYDCAYAPTSNVGNYTIAIAGVDAANYDITFVNGKVTVNQAALTITADNKSVIYGDAAPEFTATYSGWKNSDDAAVVSGLTLTSEYLVTSNIGTYDIVPANATATNYAITFVNGTLTVNQAPLTITADDKSVEYGEEHPAFTASYSGWKNNDTTDVISGLTLTSEYLVTSNVGNYDIVPANATATNYAITFVKGTLTVNQAPLMITADNKSVEYGEIAPTFTASYSGWKNSDDAAVVSGLTLTCEYLVTSNVGDYDIVPANATATNYAISFINGTLTVNQAPLTITAEDKTMIYGDEHPEFTATYAGWKNSDDAAVVSGLAYSCAYAPGSAIGTYAIEPNSATAQNYAITFVNGTLTVNKAVVTVSGAEAQIAKFADGHANAVVLNAGQLNGIKLSDPIAHNTTAVFSSADVAEHLTITLFYELTGDAALLNNYDLQPASEIFSTEGVIIEPFIPNDDHQPEDGEQVEVEEGIDVYAYGYCDGSGYSLKYHLNSGNPDQYKIDFADSRFTDVDWTKLVNAGKDGTIDIEIPVDMPTGDYSMTVYFRDSRFTWLESRALTVTFHVNLPETYVKPMFNNTIILVDTCECFTDIQWYHRNNSSEPWQPIEGATGHYYRPADGSKLTGEYFVKASMNGVPTYTCGQDDMETLYGGDKKNATKVSAYPNPVVTTTTVTIEESDNYEHSLRIVNLMGVEVENSRFEGNVTTVEMTGYPQGNYMISVDGIVVKVMKK